MNRPSDRLLRLMQRKEGFRDCGMNGFSELLAICQEMQEITDRPWCEPPE